MWDEPMPKWRKAQKQHQCQGDGCAKVTAVPKLSRAAIAISTGPFASRHIAISDTARSALSLLSKGPTVIAS